MATPDGVSPTTKEGKALAKELEDQGKIGVQQADYDTLHSLVPSLVGKDMLGSDQLATVRKMAAIARAMPVSQVIFGDSVAPYRKFESSIFVVDRPTGVRIKIRPDMMIEPCAQFPDGLIVDGKSTQDAGDEAFGRQCWNLGYGLQAAFYTRVFSQVYGCRPPFILLAQEKEPPLAAAAYQVPPDLMQHYDATINSALLKFAECERTGQWPGYSTQVRMLTVPSFAQRMIDEAAA